MKKLIRIATRESVLALWQANYVKATLIAKFPYLTIELVGMTTEGDRRLGVALANVGGKGLFVKELEIAIEEGRADLAVHSMKDVPIELPDGFIMPAIIDRANPYDAFVSNKFASIEELPQGAIVGTSSLRRSCQLNALRPDLTIKILRGNVNTRLRKLDDGEYDAIILAVAGLQRLQMNDRIRAIMPSEISLPAAGQGAMGIECLAKDEELVEIVKTLDHLPTRQCVSAERALNRYLEGGCHVPIGAYALIEDNQLYLRGLVGRPDGSLVLRGEIKGALEQAENLGESLAQDLIKQGADKILKEVYQQHG